MEVVHRIVGISLIIKLMKPTLNTFSETANSGQFRVWQPRVLVLTPSLVNPLSETGPRAKLRSTHFRKENLSGPPLSSRWMVNLFIKPLCLCCHLLTEKRLYKDKKSAVRWLSAGSALGIGDIVGRLGRHLLEGCTSCALLLGKNIKIKP